MTDDLAGLKPILYRVPSADPLYVVEIAWRGSQGCTEHWAITSGGRVLNRAGEWEWEPQPSSRTDDFIARTRYGSPAEAFHAFKIYQRERWAIVVISMKDGKP